MDTIFSQSFLRENLMGPNCVRIIDEMFEGIELPSGIRILDLGCGTALTSIYLAKKYQAQVFAVDMWINPTENYKCIEVFELTDKIIPVYADASMGLPFAKGYFDLIVSVDAYHYFGTADTYLDDKIAPLIKSGGQIKVAIPGLQREFADDDVPEEMQPYWQEVKHFDSANWWENLWRKSQLINVEGCSSLKCHEQAWLDWLACDNPHAKHDIDMMAAEGGKYFDTIQIVGRKKQ